MAKKKKKKSDIAWDNENVIKSEELFKKQEDNKSETVFANDNALNVQEELPLIDENSESDLPIYGSENGEKIQGAEDESEAESEEAEAESETEAVEEVSEDIDNADNESTEAESDKAETESEAEAVEEVSEDIDNADNESAEAESDKAETESEAEAESDAEIAEEVESEEKAETESEEAESKEQTVEEVSEDVENANDESAKTEREEVESGAEVSEEVSETAENTEDESAEVETDSEADVEQNEQEQAEEIKRNITNYQQITELNSLYGIGEFEETFAEINQFYSKEDEQTDGQIEGQIAEQVIAFEEGFESEEPGKDADNSDDDSADDSGAEVENEPEIADENEIDELNQKDIQDNANEEMQSIIELNMLENLQENSDFIEGEFAFELQQKSDENTDEQNLDLLEGYDAKLHLQDDGIEEQEESANNSAKMQESDKKEQAELDAQIYETEQISNEKLSVKDIQITQEEITQDEVYDDIKELNLLDGMDEFMNFGEEAGPENAQKEEKPEAANALQNKSGFLPLLKKDSEKKTQKLLDKKLKKEQEKKKKIKKKKENLTRKRMGCFGIFVIFSFLIIVGCVYTVYDLIGRRLLSEPVEVELPNFVGLYADDVIDDAQNNVFNIEIESVFEEGVNAGIILSQFPVAPRTVKADSRVVLRVNTPPQLVEIPNLTGMDRSEVKDELSIYELSAFFKTVDDEDAPDNTVLYTEPKASQQILQGSTVTVFVSRDPLATNISVPSVVGLSVDKAIDTLNAAGLSYDLTGSSSGNVLSQSPAAGAYVTRGASITLTTKAVAQNVPGVFVHSPTDGHAHDFALVQSNIGEGGLSMYTCRLCGMQSLGYQ